MLNHAKAEHDVILAGGEGKAKSIRLDNAMVLGHREVRDVRIDGGTQVNRGDVRPRRQEHLGESARTATDFQNVGSLVAVKHAPALVSKTPTRSVPRNGGVGVRVELC